MSRETEGAVKNNKFSLYKKKLKYGSIATVITVVFIVFVIVINLIAGILTDRKNLKLDLTKEKYYEVSDKTTDYLKTIDQDVEIALMGKKADYETSTAYAKMIVEILERYKQGSEHISVEFYDIASNPDVVSKYSQNYNGTIQEGNIVVSSGDRVKVMSINDLFTFEQSAYGSSSIKGFNGEQLLTSAVMSVTDANPKKVAFIAGYNGSSIYSPYVTYAISSFYSMMEKNGYEINMIDIFSDELNPEDYDIVVLPAPVSDISEDCIKKLEDFLYNGGSLDKDMIYIADVYQYRTPNIDEFLEVWGIEIGDGWVYETDESLTQNAQIVVGGKTLQMPSAIASIADEKYSESLSNTKLPIVAPRARSINLLFDANVDRTTSALLKTSDSTCLYPITMMDAPEKDENLIEFGTDANQETTEAETEASTEAPTEFDPDSAEKGSHVVMALASKTSMDENNQQHINNVLVIGGSAITDSMIVSSDLYNNAEFVINSVNQMCGKENGIIIAEKNVSVDYMDIKASQARVINRVIMFVIPLSVCVAGVIVFIRRRNR